MAPGLLNAQVDFKIADRDVQIHSFASQGFAYSNDNNFLTMKTSQGSFAMTDGGVNVSTQLTDKFRVGAQVYVRSVGRLGDWHPLLDWAYIDYRAKDWFGVRAGRVKTSLGLYTDTQDAESLHTWALLPQAMYPSDLRSATIAHDGLDIYGNISLRRAGSLSYTTYAGLRPTDKASGVYFATQDNGVIIKSIAAGLAGTDLRWTTPINGLMIGASEIFYSERKDIPSKAFPTAISVVGPGRQTAAYADYASHGFHVAGEYRRNFALKNVRNFIYVPDLIRNQSERSWFTSAAYRVNRWFEFGGYYSHYTLDKPWLSAPQFSHIFDKVIAARFDPTKFWTIKIEGHFMDGNGDPYAPHGFYSSANPKGMAPTTNMLVVRTGWSF
jgi:hypothetical protein